MWWYVVLHAVDIDKGFHITLNAVVGTFQRKQNNILHDMVYYLTCGRYNNNKGFHIILHTVDTLIRQLNIILHSVVTFVCTFRCYTKKISIHSRNINYARVVAFSIIELLKI